LHLSSPLLPFALVRSAIPGENYELRADLNSEITSKRADAIKRVIANMTVGKDVSGLFPSVLLNMVSSSLPCCRMPVEGREDGGRNYGS
jgi:vesicle coat complex subunit